MTQEHNYDPARVRDFFNRLGYGEWERLEQSATSRTQARIHTHYLHRFFDRGSRVLDAGAGAGRFTVELARLGATVSVVDISDEQLRLNRQKVAEAGLAGLCGRMAQGRLPQSKSLPRRDLRRDGLLRRRTQLRTRACGRRPGGAVESHQARRIRGPQCPECNRNGPNVAPPVSQHGSSATDERTSITRWRPATPWAPRKQVTGRTCTAGASSRSFCWTTAVRSSPPRPRASCLILNDDVVAAFEKDSGPLRLVSSLGDRILSRARRARWRRPTDRGRQTRRVSA